MAAKPRQRATPKTGIEDRIVDAALAAAEEAGWENVRLSDVARGLGMSAAELRRHFRDLDAVADAWFDRAMDAMLRLPDRRFYALPARERLYRLMLAWFDALAEHRRVTGEMLAAKMHPPHPHHWVPMIFNLSRTIQWLRDAAGLAAGGRRRQIEEIGLTALFLATLAVWLRDDSEAQERTRAYLDRRLIRADALVARLFGPA